MNKLTKENLNDFLIYYHNLHDSYITYISYDIIKSQIELSIDVCWSGKSTRKQNGSYETNKVKMKIVFEEIIEYDNKEIFSWDYINHAYIKFICLENNEYIYFANEEKKPFIYIVCKSIKYKEL